MLVNDWLTDCLTACLPDWLTDWLVPKFRDFKANPNAIFCLGTYSVLISDGIDGIFGVVGVEYSWFKIDGQI